MRLALNMAVVSLQICGFNGFRSGSADGCAEFLKDALNRFGKIGDVGVNTAGLFFLAI